MTQIDINYFAVIVATVIGMVLGAFWYSPALFAKPWMNLVGKKQADFSMQAANIGYAVAVLANFIMAYILAHFVHYTGATTIATGAVTGFWLWLGFVAAPTLMNYIFEGRSVKLFSINTGLTLVSLLIMGAVLAVWR